MKFINGIFSPLLCLLENGKKHQKSNERTNLAIVKRMNEQCNKEDTMLQWIEMYNEKKQDDLSRFIWH